MRAFVILVVFALSSAAQQWPQPRPVEVARGLALVTDIQSPRDGSGRLFILEQAGRIRVLKGGQLLVEPFLDIRSRVVSGGERGLLGLAFPPDYAAKGWFYVNYTEGRGAPDLRTVIARYRVSPDNPDLADPASEERILVVNQPFDNHNAGQLAFSPLDGYLYIGLGDGGSGNDPQRNGQNPAALLGKMLRIDVESSVASGATPYRIPDSNPFLDDSRFRPEIWALGLRNPWRYSFDRESGDLWIADVGQNRLEEVNFQPASSPGGENYGWVTMEASLCVTPGCNTAGLTLPVFEYGRNLGASITGGFVYRGSRYPSRRGVYFVADYVSARIWAVRRGASGWENRQISELPGRLISTFGEDEDGEIFFATYDARDSRIFWLADERPATRPDLIVNSATGEPGVALGSRVNIYGWGIAARPQQTRVLFDNLEARVVGVDTIDGSDLVMAVVPESLRGRTTAQVTVISGESVSDPVEVGISDLQPGIYPLGYTGSPGGRVMLLVSGIGSCARSISVSAGRLESCAASEWFPGAWELMISLSADLPRGDQPLTLQVDGLTSPASRIRIN
jgi:glucose/arabinose dehydrogenase